MSKSKFSPKEILLPTIVLLIICIVASALLGGTNMLTKDKIAQINNETKSAAMQTVMPDAVSFGDAVQTDNNKVEYSPALNGDGTVIGYAFTVSESGYGGEISVMVGMDTAGVVKKVTIVSADDETPGLGQNVKKDSFLEQFSEKIGQLIITKNAPKNDNEIQAVTSATITSSAVVRAVNAAVEYCNENLVQGGNKNG